MYSKVSLLITSYRRLDFIKNFIDSITRNTNHPNFEIVIVNTCPGHNTSLDSYLTSYSLRHKVISDGVKRQFMEGIEEAYNKSDGEYVVLLNDDMLLPMNQRNWLLNMQKYLMNNDDVATCSIYQYLDGYRLYTLGETDIDKPGHTCGAYTLKLNELPKEKEVLWNNFSCTMMPRNFVENNRFLDVIPPPQYHYGSDSCYCRHVINQGKRNMLINDSWIYHFNSREIKGIYGRYVYNGI